MGFARLLKVRIPGFIGNYYAEVRYQPYTRAAASNRMNVHLHTHHQRIGFIVRLRFRF
jgi:hypothetical protein